MNGIFLLWNGRKEGEWLDLGLGITGKKLVDPTEWH
jgi:hypothetical protein